MAPPPASRPVVHPLLRLALSLLVIFLVLGTLLSLTSGTSPSHLQAAAHIPASALKYLSPSERPRSYWGDKRNIVNRVFVKRGWGWTSVVVWVLAAADAYFSSAAGHGQIGQSRSIKTLGRYVVATVGWIVVTQAFFGPSLSDRLLLMTGSRCVASLGEFVESDAPLALEPGIVVGGAEKGVLGVGRTRIGVLKAGEKVVERELCMRVWGRRLPGADVGKMTKLKPYWFGGLDISGHAFLLSLSILVLVSAIRPLVALYNSSAPSTPGSQASTAPPSSSGSAEPKPKVPSKLSQTDRLVIRCLLLGASGLTALWFWMFLMTSIHFHGPIEKVLGLGAGVGVWWIGESVLGD